MTSKSDKAIGMLLLVACGVVLARIFTLPAPDWSTHTVSSWVYVPMASALAIAVGAGCGAGISWLIIDDRDFGVIVSACSGAATCIFGLLLLVFGFPLAAGYLPDTAFSAAAGVALGVGAFLHGWQLVTHRH